MVWLYTDMITWQVRRHGTGNYLCDKHNNYLNKGAGNKYSTYHTASPGFFFLENIQLCFTFFHLASHNTDFVSSGSIISRATDHRATTLASPTRRDQSKQAISDQSCSSIHQIVTVLLRAGAYSPIYLMDPGWYVIWWLNHIPKNFGGKKNWVVSVLPDVLGPLHRAGSRVVPLVWTT